MFFREESYEFVYLPPRRSSKSDDPVDKLISSSPCLILTIYVRIDDRYKFNKKELNIFLAFSIFTTKFRN